MLAELVSPEVGPSASFASMPGVGGRAGHEIELVLAAAQRDPSGRVGADPDRGVRAGEILGTLSVGFSLDDTRGGAIQARSRTATSRSASTARSTRRRCRRRTGRRSPRSCRDGSWTHVPVGGQEYIAKTRELSPSSTSGDGVGRTETPAAAPGARDHPPLAHRAAALPEPAAPPAGDHRLRRRARRHAPQLRHRADGHPAARRDHRDHARDGGDRRPDAADSRRRPARCGTTKTRGCWRRRSTR